MASRYPRFYADDRGVWEEDTSGTSSGWEWTEIVTVSAYKKDDPEGRLEVSLEHESSRDLSLHANSPGFAEVIEAVTRRFAIPDGWVPGVARQPSGTHVTVWRRSETERPMAGYPRLAADDRGVWREDGPSHRFVIAWDKIDGVTGLRGFSASDEVVCTGLALDLSDNDHPLYLDAGWPNFTEVVEALTHRLPGLTAGWFAQIAQFPRLTADAPPDSALMVDVPVWSRPDPEGYPRHFTDEQGVWIENRPGQRFGHAWSEINSVRCSFATGSGGETVVSVLLEAENGNLLLGGPHIDPHEPQEPSLGLVGVVTSRLGMPEGWFVKAKAMKPTRGPMVVWTRPDPSWDLRVDDHGMWCRPLFIEWSSIFGVIVSKRYERERPHGGLYVELDVANGPRQSLYDLRPGFTQVVQTMTARLPDMPAKWFAEAQRLEPGKTVTVWRRTYPDGYPRLHADDHGVWRWDTPGQPFGIAWDAISNVRGRKEEGPSGYLEVELARADGSGSLFLQSHWQNFAAVVEGITNRLPSIPAKWLTKLEELEPGFSIWRRR